MKRLGVLAIVGIGLLVSGCSEEVSFNKEDVFEVDAKEIEIVKTDTSSNYKEIIYDTVYKYNDFVQEVYVDIFKDDMTPAKKEEYTKLTVEYLNHINGINPYSLGIEDKVLEQYFRDFDYHTTMVAEYVLKSLSNNEKHIRSIMKDYYNDAINDLTLLTSILEPTN